METIEVRKITKEIAQELTSSLEPIISFHYDFSENLKEQLNVLKKFEELREFEKLKNVNDLAVITCFHKPNKGIKFRVFNETMKGPGGIDCLMVKASFGLDLITTTMKSEGLPISVLEQVLRAISSGKLNIFEISISILTRALLDNIFSGKPNIEVLREHKSILMNTIFDAPDTQKKLVRFLNMIS